MGRPVLLARAASLSSRVVLARSYLSKAKVGKHGAAKCAFTGIDIFNGKKLECIAPASAGLSQPIVERNEYELCDISDDDFVTLMGGDGSMREDIKVPEDKTVAEKL